MVATANIQMSFILTSKSMDLVDFYHVKEVICLSMIDNLCSDYLNGGYYLGILKRNVDPFPASLSTHIFPLCC